MSTKRVCDMSCGAMHEFALALDKAGFDADLAQEIVNSRGNKHAKAMFAAVTGVSTKEVVQPNPDDRHFKCILDTGYITIPDMQTIVADAKQLWSNEMDGVRIPAGLETGARKRILLFELVTGRSSQQIVDFCKKQPGAVMPNVFGLRIAEVTVGSKLPKDWWMRGFDDRNNLSVDARGDRRVPYLCLFSGGGVFRDWRYWGYGWSAGLRFILFCD